MFQETMEEKLIRESFVFYKGFNDALEDIHGEEFENCVRALFEYALNGETLEVTGLAKMYLTMAKPQIDANNKRWQNGRKSMVSVTSEAEKKECVPKPVPKATQRAPKQTPKATQDAPKPTPKDTQDVPKPTPKDTQDVPKPTPKDTQDAPKPTPKDTQDVPKPTPNVNANVNVNANDNDNANVNVHENENYNDNLNEDVYEDVYEDIDENDLYDTEHEDSPLPWGEYSNVFLTAKEKSKLDSELGIVRAHKSIDHLSRYLQRKGDSYKSNSHYEDIRGWVQKALTENEEFARKHFSPGLSHPPGYKPFGGIDLESIGAKLFENPDT